MVPLSFKCFYVVSSRVVRGPVWFCRAHCFELHQANHHGESDTPEGPGPDARVLETLSYHAPANHATQEMCADITTASDQEMDR